MIIIKCLVCFLFRRNASEQIITDSGSEAHTLPDHCAQTSARQTSARQASAHCPFFPGSSPQPRNFLMLSLCSGLPSAL